MGSLPARHAGRVDDTDRMRPLADFAGQELHWVQPAALRREHELRGADEVVATLVFGRRTFATGIADAGQWSFRRAGLWRPQVTVRGAGSETDMAFFRPHRSGGGALDFPDGRLLRLSSASVWQSPWVWRKGDNELMRFRGGQGLLKAGCAVDIAPHAARMPDLALLALLGWYLILLYAQDEAAASAAAAAAIASS